MTATATAAPPVSISFLLAKEPVGPLTSPTMSDYEFAKIIGDRAVEIATKGSPLLLSKEEQGKETHFGRLAQLEFENRRLDLYIRRVLPNGTVEMRHIKDLERLCDTTPAKP
jgi:hypothetical protein